MLSPGQSAMLPPTWWRPASGTEEMHIPVHELRSIGNRLDRPFHLLLAWTYMLQRCAPFMLRTRRNLLRRPVLSPRAEMHQSGRVLPRRAVGLRKHLLSAGPGVQRSCDRHLLRIPDGLRKHVLRRIRLL